MLIESTRKNSYQIFKIKEDLFFSSNIPGLKRLIEESLAKGITSIALQFTEKSQLGSPSIRTLVQCFEIISNREGKVAVIRPCSDILFSLDIIGFKSIVKVVDSEDELM